MATVDQICLPEGEGAGGKKFYAPRLLKVAGTSSYNKRQLKFEGLDGFWELPEDSKVPPRDSIIWVKLATKPKTGPKTKPGSMYMDIVQLDRALDEDKAQYQPPYSDVSYTEPAYSAPASGYREPETAQSSTKQDYWDTKDSRISKAQAWNGLTQVVASGAALRLIAKHIVGPDAEPADVEAAEYRLLEDWREGYERLRRGQAPFPDVDAAEREWDGTAKAEADASVEEAVGMKASQPDFDGQQHPPQPAGERDDQITELPW